MKTLQERLIWARSLKGERDGKEFTQQDLANRAGVSQGSIAHLESGRTKTARNLVAIAEALSVQPRWLAEGKGLPFADGSQEKEWALDRFARSGITAPTEPPPPDVPTKEPEPVISLIHVDSKDLLLLTLFHGTDDDGREKILRTAARMPKVVGVRSVRHQTKA